MATGQARKKPAQKKAGLRKPSQSKPSQSKPSQSPGKVKSLGKLPVWKLDDLYPGMESAQLKADLERCGIAAEAFEQRYKGHVASLPPDDLARAIADYEVQQDRIGRLLSYASLVYASDMSDARIGRFYQSINESVTDHTSKLLFFTLEINRIEDDVLRRMLAQSMALNHYQPWLRDLRAFRPYQLGDELEKLLHEKSVSGRSAWTRLFDETMAGLRFKLGNRQLTVEQVLHLLSDRDRRKRKSAAKSLGLVFNEKIKLFSLITNTLAKDKEIEDRWRKLPSPETSRHIANCVEQPVVDALVQAVQASYPKLSHRYYRLKAHWLGTRRLDWWDRNAPLPQDSDRFYNWTDARDTVLGAYGRFSPKLADLGRKFFDNAWIDAPSRPGKASGAFAHPTVPSAHPYLLLNYQGRSRDVMTLAHELGHGVHQLLAAEQGTLMADTPLTLAETASVFGEQLTFRALLANAKPGQRHIMLAQKVEDMLNTVVRQVAFFEFERRVHRERREGELTPERLGDIWLGVQGESLGPALKFDDDYRNFWCYIPHFVHSPFYVYAYAFGDCLVNALYAVYENAHEGFQERYFAMLKAGGTQRHQELLAPFGLNAADPAFWSKGLGLIERFIDELEQG